MPRRLPPAQADDQSARFIEAARALSCDEDEAAFDAQLAALARHKPSDDGLPDSKEAAPKPKRPPSS